MCGPRGAWKLNGVLIPVATSKITTFTQTKLTSCCKSGTKVSFCAQADSTKETSIKGMSIKVVPKCTYVFFVLMLSEFGPIEAGLVLDTMAASAFPNLKARGFVQKHANITIMALQDCLL